MHVTLFVNKATHEIVRTDPPGWEGAITVVRDHFCLPVLQHFETLEMISWGLEFVDTETNLAQ